MNNTVAGLLGEFAAYTVIGWAFIELVAMLSESAVFKRVMDDPLRGKLASAITGYFTVCTLLGLGTVGVYGTFDPSWFVRLLPAGIIVGFFRLRRGLKLQGQVEPHEELEDTFR